MNHERFTERVEVWSSNRTSIVFPNIHFNEENFDGEAVSDAKSSLIKKQTGNGRVSVTTTEFGTCADTSSDER
jgi:hypothetical protein